MADLLYDVLNHAGAGLGSNDAAADASSLEYLKTLASQSLTSLETSEQQALSQELHSVQTALQNLSKKSHKAVIESASCHGDLQSSLPALTTSAAELRHAIPRLDTEAVRFSTNYNKTSDKYVLARRKKALVLSRNVERLVDVLELPTLMSTAISTASPNYSSALDINGYVRRLHSLFPGSRLMASISGQADEAMYDMASQLILSLKMPSLKLAASLRTISWLRRMLPDLGIHVAATKSRAVQERLLGSLFLVCRLATLMNMLDALEPLRILADQERTRQESVGTWSGGQQSERYLKRYVEVFREQSFAMLSMYRSIFPECVLSNDRKKPVSELDPLEPVSSALTSFPLYLSDNLMEALKRYLPVVKDQASRDSLLTQVLYCAGSLGRLGGDFGLFLVDLGAGDETEEEWVEVVKRHRLMSGRLESLVGEQRDIRKGR